MVGTAKKKENSKAVFLFNRKCFTRILDQKLRQVNSDYDAKRYKDIALKMPVVHQAPHGLFESWLRKKGKLGGQHKVPRLSNSREYLEEILAMMK